MSETNGAALLPLRKSEREKGETKELRGKGKVPKAKKGAAEAGGKALPYVMAFGLAFFSACLNAHANALHATIPWAGWAMGFAVPLIVLGLARLAAERYRKGQRGRAWAGVCIGVGLLALSVWHCALSISLLTGTHILLALPMAVAIDAGLVYAELCVLD